MSAEDLKRRAVESLRVRRKELVSQVLGQRHHGAAVSEVSKGVAAAIQPSTMEAIGAMTVQLNAQIRQIDDSIAAIEAAFKAVTAPPEPDDGDIPVTTERMYG